MICTTAMAHVKWGSEEMILFSPDRMHSARVPPCLVFFLFSSSNLSCVKWRFRRDLQTTSGGGFCSRFQSSIKSFSVASTTMSKFVPFPLCSFTSRLYFAYMLGDVHFVWFVWFVWLSTLRSMTQTVNKLLASSEVKIFLRIQAASHFRLEPERDVNTSLASGVARTRGSLEQRPLLVTHRAHTLSYYYFFFLY